MSDNTVLWLTWAGSGHADESGRRFFAVDGKAVILREGPGRLPQPEHRESRIHDHELAGIGVNKRPRLTGFPLRHKSGSLP